MWSQDRTHTFWSDPLNIEPCEFPRLLIAIRWCRECADAPHVAPAPLYAFQLFCAGSFQIGWSPAWPFYSIWSWLSFSSQRIRLFALWVWAGQISWRWALADPARTSTSFHSNRQYLCFPPLSCRSWPIGCFIKCSASGEHDEIAIDRHINQLRPFVSFMIYIIKHFSIGLNYNSLIWYRYVLSGIIIIVSKVLVKSQMNG